MKTKIRFTNIVFALAILGLFLFLGLHGICEVYEPDTCFHIQSGRLIWETRSIPRHDPFSFTLEGKDWIDHEWLFQLLTYFFYAPFGITGLVYLRTVIIWAIFIVLLVWGLKKDASLLNIFILFLSVFVVRCRFHPRPELFTLLFVALYFYLIFMTPRKIILLPLIQVLWVNMHGYFIIGPILIFMVWMGKLVSAKTGLLLSWREANQDPKALKKIFVMTLLACLVNPYTYRGALYPLEAILSNFNHGQVAFKMIVELKSPFTIQNLFQPDYLAFKIMAAAVAASFLLNVRSLNISLFCLWAAAFVLSLFASRHLGIFGVVSYLAFVDNLAFIKRLPCWPRISPTGWITAGRVVLAGIIWVMVVLFIFYGIQGYYVFHQRSLKPLFFGMSQTIFPFSATNFVKDHLSGAKMFNDFNCGSFLIYSLFPRQKVFIDGRSELYGPEFLAMYRDIVEGNKEVIEDVFSRYGIECAFLSSTFSDAPPGILRYLYFSPQWKLVYFDEFASIYVRDIDKYKPLIATYGVDLDKDTVPACDLKGLPPTKIFPYRFLNRAYILETLELDEAVIKEAALASRICPDNAAAHSLMGVACFRQDRVGEAFENFRAACLLAPSVPEFRNNLGACYGRLGLYQEAIRECRQSLRLDACYASAYINLFKALTVQGDTEGAIKTLHRAMRHLPRVYEFPYRLAQTYVRKGDRRKAVVYFEKALFLAPRESSVLTEFGICLLELGEEELGKWYLGKAIEVAPDRPQPYYNLGIFFARKGIFKEAVAQLEKALQRDPENTMIQEGVAKAKRLLEKRDERSAH